MKNCLAKMTLMFGLAFATCHVFAAHQPATHNTTIKSVEEIRQIVQKIIDVNLGFQEKFHNILTEETLKQQTPHATIVLCSDSRVDMDVLSDSPTGEYFVVRNIGNQIPTAYGSVEYGVNHLHTELLIIVGHSGCGAIKAAMSDYSAESKNIRGELNSLHTNPKMDLNQNLVKNVNNQVETALKTFKTKVETKELVILGMVYDMHDDFKHGNGQLILVNVNGETNPQMLLKNVYVADLKNIVFLN